jgi:plastocyanin
MLILAATVSFLAALVVCTEHETHIVAVGAANNLTFNPTSVVASSGDTIIFLLWGAPSSPPLMHH